VRGGFFHTFGTDPIWWLTIIITIGILLTLELVYKCIKSSLILTGWWPLWGKGGQETHRNVNIEVWQELEQDEAIRERLERRVIDREG